MVLRFGGKAGILAVRAGIASGPAAPCGIIIRSIRMFGANGTRMGFFTNLRSDRLIHQIKSTNDP
jgi:hypothetical protein